MTTAEVRRIPAAGVELSCQLWPGDGPTIVGIHGLASHSGAFTGLADQLAPDVRFVAFDLRGRGDADKPDNGPFGMAVHARDVAAALDGLGIDGPVVVAGHSMGAYVASSFAAQFPDRTAAVVLIDGGLPASRTDLDPDMLLEMVLGDYMKRLRTPWSDLPELVADLEEGDLYRGRVDDLVRAYFADGLVPTSGGLLSKVSEAAVRADWRDLLTNEASWTNPAAVTQPALLVRALDGLTGVGDQVVADPTRDALVALIPQLQVVDLPGENHHTLLTTLDGSARTAQIVRDFLDTLPK